MLMSWSTPFCLCFSLRMTLTTNSSNFWAWFKLSALVFFLCCFQHPSHRLRSFRSHNSPCWWVSFIYICLLLKLLSDDHCQYLFPNLIHLMKKMNFSYDHAFSSYEPFLRFERLSAVNEDGFDEWLLCRCFWEFFFLSFLLLFHFQFFRVSGFSIFDFIRVELLPDGNSWLLLLELFSFFWHVCRINLTWIDFFYISDSISLLCCMLLSWDPLTL